MMGYIMHLWEETGQLPINKWTLRSLQRRADAWYEEMRMQRGYGFSSSFYENASWAGADYPTLAFDEGGLSYEIVQLCSAHALAEESMHMSHCVRTYSWKCLEHGTSIWSLRSVNGEAITRLVTIEVSKHRKIVQAKGKYNAEPTLADWKMIKQWAGKAELVL